MFAMRRSYLLLSLAAVLLLGGCNYARKMMYVTLVNRSGEAMRNVELRYPTASFGLAELRSGQTHQHMVPVGSPCTFELDFDGGGKKYVQKAEFGANCPTEVEFTVDVGMKISSQVLRP
jgi:hypothetical protein